MKKEDRKPTAKVVIELTDWQSEIFDRVIEPLKEANKGQEITREIVLTDLCTTYIAEEGKKLIKRG